jgi:hypothetical protein
MLYPIKMSACEGNLHLRRSRCKSKQREVQLCWTGVDAKQFRGGRAGGLPRPLAAPKAHEMAAVARQLRALFTKGFFLVRR